MSSNVDIRGICRGACHDCSCMEFLREGTSRSQHPEWCAYCGRPPTSHNEIEHLTDLRMVDHPAREKVTHEKDDSVEDSELRGGRQVPGRIYDEKAEEALI
ncbi:unnamed protein product [Ixodes pacificus]